MIYRLAKKSDIYAICDLVKSAVQELENNRIFQWDDIYPNREDFLDDIKKEQLFVGESDSDILVIYAINKECDDQYQNGNWKYPDSEYRVIHRLCVNPKCQGRGIAGKTLAYIENTLRNNGVETVRLDVFNNNPYALSLYSKSGYKKVGTANWRKGEFSLMEKHL